ncbi:MAG: RDD family protein [Clostridia bacterium]|nr:RDD family protein [Clostridia bacterium]
MYDLQRAAFSKRLFAFLADLILAAILITGVYFVMSAALDVDGYNAKYTEILKSYENKYGVTFGVTQEQYGAMTQEEKDNYRAAVDAMNSDAEANDAIKTSYRLVFIIFSVGIILSMTLLEFVIPLLFGDGRTLGKRLFGLGVMRRSSLKISPASLLIRGVIGKAVFEMILPVLIFLSVITGVTGVFGVIMLAVYLAAEIVAYATSHTGAFLHDVLADTVVVDWDSQMIFGTAEERDAYYENKKASEEARRLY